MNFENLRNLTGRQNDSKNHENPRFCKTLQNPFPWDHAQMIERKILCRIALNNACFFACLLLVVLACPSQILNSQQDPFNRAPMTEADLVPNVQLKARIDAFKVEHRL